MPAKVMKIHKKPKKNAKICQNFFRNNAKIPFFLKVRFNNIIILAPRTCRNVASFTRVPQMILVGFAAFVMENVPSVTMCLDQCTK